MPQLDIAPLISVITIPPYVPSAAHFICVTFPTDIDCVVTPAPPYTPTWVEDGVSFFILCVGRGGDHLLEYECIVALKQTSRNEKKASRQPNPHILHFWSTKHLEDICDVDVFL